MRKQFFSESKGLACLNQNAQYSAINQKPLIATCEEQMLTQNLLASNLRREIVNSDGFVSTCWYHIPNPNRLKIELQAIRDQQNLQEGNDRNNENEEAENNSDDDDEDSENGDDEDEQEEWERTLLPGHIPILRKNGNLLEYVTTVASQDCHNYADFAVRINHAWATDNDTVPLTEVNIETAWPGRLISYQHYIRQMDYYVELPPSPWAVGGLVH